MPYVRSPPKLIRVTYIVTEERAARGLTTGVGYCYLPQVKTWTDDDPIWKPFREFSEMKKKAQVDQKAKGKYQPHPEPLLKGRPTIGMFMYDCWYDDGSPRELSKLSIGLVPSGVQISLTDPDNRSTAFTTSSSVSEALDELEKALTSNVDPWRPWPKSFGKK